MSLFLEILTEITLPVLALVALGWLVQPRMQLSVESLTKMQLYVILPAFLIHFLSSAALPLSAIWPTTWFTVVQFLLLLALGWLIAAIMRVPATMRPVVALTMAFPNTGNFGIPLAQLAFPADFVLHQAVIVSLQTVLIVTIGIWLLTPRDENKLEFIKSLAANPMILAVVLGLALKGFDLELPKVLSTPLRLLGMAFAPLALFTLGVQLSGSLGRIRPGILSLTLLLKLALAPAVSWAVLLAFGFEPDLTALLVVAAAAPVGVLLPIFCQQYDTHPNVAAAAVFFSTLLSPIFVTIWVLATRSF